MKEEDIRKRSTFNRYLELVQKDAEGMSVDKSIFQTIPCPACRQSAFNVEFVKWGFTYVTCTDCKTLYVNPRPSLEALLNYYTKSASSYFWANEFFKLVEDNRKKLIFGPRVDFVTETFPELSGGIIGDIGAGLGLFLEELRNYWPSARLIAIEPSGEECRICRQKGLEVIPSALEEVTGWDGRFDFLTAFELLEHLYDPNEFLNRVSALLKPGGYVYMTTLNSHGFDIQVLWDQSKCFSPPNHLNFFNPASIKKMFENNGFSIITVDTPGVLDVNIVEGMVKNESAMVARIWRMIIDSDEVTKRNLQTWITDSKLSSHMRIVAVKK